MTATLTYAEANKAVEYVLVFLVEGCEIAYTSHSDAAAIKELWTATGHGSMTASWRHGLEVDGSITSKIKLFDPKVEADHLTIKLLDSDDYLIGLTQAEASSSADRTVLRAEIDHDATSVPVEGVGGFATSGAIYVGHERITYTATTGGGSPTFDTCTRGTLALFKTNGATNFAAAHGVGTTINDGSQAVEVYSTPRIWLNRRCGLYVLHRENGTFVDGATPLCVWAGRIKSISDSDDGWISFETANIAEQFDSLVFSNQYQAELQPGAFFPVISQIKVLLATPTPTTDSYGPVDCISAGVRTHQDVAARIETQLRAAEVAGSLASGWQLKLEDTGADGPRYVFRFASSSGNTLAFVFLSEIALSVLGFEGNGEGVDADGERLLGVRLQKESGNFYSAVASGPPLVSFQILKWGERLRTVTEGQEGTWIDQVNIPIESRARVGLTTNGYMMIDGRYTVAVQDNNDGSFDITQNNLGRLDDIVDGFPVTGLAIRIPDDGKNRPIKIKQVWLEYGDVATLMLRLALSTGTTGGYNHATYDNLTGIGFGVGIPSSVLDINTWVGIQGSGYWLILDKPKKFSEILEDALAVRGAYLVWRRGKLAIVAPTEPSNGDGDYDMTEANKADTKLTTYKRSSDSVINVCKIKLNRTVAGQYLDEVTIRAGASISDLGERKPVTIEASGVYSGLLGHGGGLAEAQETMAMALAYFSRPACEVTRSYSHALMGLAAGDTVNLTDERVVDPTTGTRGVTLWPCWVAEARFDVNTGAGEARLIFLPEFDKAQRSRWAPTAEVASSVVTASKLVLTCTAHKYTPSTDTAVDASYFPAGSICRLIEVSPTNPASPTTYTGLVVESVSTNDITLTTDPATGALSTSKRFVLEFEDYSTVTSGQQGSHSFIALETTRRILTVLSSFARTWMPTVPYIPETVAYTTLHRKRVNLADDDGEPHSVGWFIDAAHSINNAFSCKRQLLISEQFDTDRTVATTTDTFVAGPIFVPLYGYGRTLTCRARCVTDDPTLKTASVKFSASISRPAGTSATAYTFIDSAESTTGLYAVCTTLTSIPTATYTSEATITLPARTSEGRLAGCWISVSATCSSPATATITGIEVWETAIA